MTVEVLAGIVERRLGLRTDDVRALESVLARRRDPGLFLARLEVGDPVELRALASELVVGETYFFRNEEQLRAFAEVVAPPCIAERGRVSVLSAGCASGEEPYTLAILLRELGPAAIEAIDIDARALARAARGAYTGWSLRAVAPEVRARWFARAGAEWQLSRAIRDAVTFHEGSLLEEGALWAPGRWDAIFCRNVTMYFTEEHARATIARFARALAPGGYLFLGHAETLRGRSDDFELCHTHGTFYYRRGGAAPGRPVRAAWHEEIAAAAERVRGLVAAAPRMASGSSPSVDAMATAPATLDEVRLLISDERYAEALGRLATISIDDPQVLVLRAVLLTQRGARDEAREACEALLRADPASAGAHYLLALGDETGGDLVAARQHARRAVALDPTFAMARLHLGLIARRLGELAAAREELGEALALLPGETDERLALFGGGFRRAALVELCRAELASVAR